VESFAVEACDFFLVMERLVLELDVGEATQVLVVSIPDGSLLGGREVGSVETPTPKLRAAREASTMLRDAPPGTDDSSDSMGENVAKPGPADKSKTAYFMLFANI
jgi:hypothetical protein